MYMAVLCENLMLFSVDVMIVNSVVRFCNGRSSSTVTSANVDYADCGGGGDDDDHHHDCGNIKLSSS
jgi:hypothetical protein